MKRIQDVAVAGKKVLVRVDYNVPIKDGKVTDDERIQASLETINYLLKNDAIVVICSHLGRPDGKPLPEFSLAQVVPSLENLINKSVQFVPECIGEKRDEIIGNTKPGDVILLENLRYHSEEEANDESFSKELASGFDLYVDDAFSNCHRAHASMVGVTHFLPASAGFALQNEVDELGKLLHEPGKPFVLISGGAKISDKINVLRNLLTKVDTLLIGGGMANTFLAATGFNIGKSLNEPDFIKEASRILNEAKSAGVKVLLPTDVLAVKEIKEGNAGEIKAVSETVDDDIIVDIGPETVVRFGDEIAASKVIFWNGPMGIDEIRDYAKGTRAVAHEIVDSKSFSVVGGGDTVASVDDDIKSRFSFVSMAGGASLEFLEGKTLPGIEALK